MSGPPPEPPPAPTEPFRLPEIRPVDGRAPWAWLRAGWADFRAAPLLSGGMGLVLALAGFAVQFLVHDTGLRLALATGILLIGPLHAGGFIEMSRGRAAGGRAPVWQVLTAWRPNVLALSLYGIILVIVLAAWLRASLVLVAIFFDGNIPDTFPQLLGSIFSSPGGVLFFFAYVAAAAGFALLVYSFSAVTLPLLIDRREMDAATAMIVSFLAVRRNFRPMLGFALLLTAGLAAGFATFYLGYILALPVLGHASWHAYAALVGAKSTAPLTPAAAG